MINANAELPLRVTIDPISKELDTLSDKIPSVEPTTPIRSAIPCDHLVHPAPVHNVSAPTNIGTQTITPPSAVRIAPSRISRLFADRTMPYADRGFPVSAKNGNPSPTATAVAAANCAPFSRAVRDDDDPTRSYRLNRATTQTNVAWTMPLMTLPIGVAPRRG